jgi:lipoic acid synthetase
MLKKPDWLKVSFNEDEVADVADLIIDLELNTVCSEAACPNRGECFSAKTATFMVMGQYCTRDCRFCNVTSTKPEALDPDEPERVAKAAATLGLEHVVVTQVTRDDLADGGAGHMAETIEALRKHNPTATIEVLVSDYRGDERAIDKVIAAKPDVYAHNVEMPRALSKTVRPDADYDRSLAVLDYVKRTAPSILTKTGFMLGLGESDEEIGELLDDLAKVKVDIVTIGQYLQPTKRHAELKRYVTPDEFETYRQIALAKGIGFVVSTPLVRSSYKAAEAVAAVRQRDLSPTL